MLDAGAGVRVHEKETSYPARGEQSDSRDG